MRTAGPTAQAAGPVGEGRPPKAQGPAEAPSLGRGRISPGLSRIVERYQSAVQPLGRRMSSPFRTLLRERPFLWSRGIFLQGGKEMRTRRNRLGLFALIAMLTLALTVLPAFAAAEDPTELTGTKYIECPDCGTAGVVLSEDGGAVPCETCADSEYPVYITSPSPFFNSAWSLLPPVIAIALALITKEVYSSLFIGILEIGRAHV